MSKYALSLLLLALAAHADQSLPVEIAPQLYFLEGRFVPGQQPDGNSVLWQGKDGLVVFDTGRHPEHTRAILDFAELTHMPILAIINSHWHLDHVGGNGTLRERFPDAKIYASNGLEHALTRFLAKYKLALEERMVDPDTTEADKATFAAELGILEQPDALRPTIVRTSSGPESVGGQALLFGLETHAVTSADLWVLDAARGVLVAGDLVTLPVPFFDTACPVSWQAALEHLTQLKFALLVPGHGAPMTRPEFLTYKSAFGALLGCAAGERETSSCISAWIHDTREFVPSTDTTQTRDMLTFYIEHNLKPENAARYCNE